MDLMGLISFGVFGLMTYFIGKRVGKNEPFGIAGSEDGIRYSFKSEKDFDKTLGKIGALAKDAEKYNILKGKILKLPKDIIEKYKL